MATITLVLLDVAHGAAVGDLALRHASVDFHLNVGSIVQRMGGTTLRPLILRPCNRVTLGLALSKFLEVAIAAYVCGGHLDVGSVISLLFRIDINVTVDTANFLQMLGLSQLAQ